MEQKISLCWFRRDLRLDDQAAFYYALRPGNPVVPVFVFDTNILNDLDDKKDRRVTFIHEVLEEMQAQLEEQGSSIDVFYGTPEAAFEHWTHKYNVAGVYTNHDYEPYAKIRDAAVAKQLSKKGISFHSYKDQVILEKDEVLKDNGDPYTIFTPYSRKWYDTLTFFHLKQYPCKKYYQHLFKQQVIKIPSLREMGFAA
ncbi:deoxyribodipyrimidine photo-lyase, partial [Chitinophaga sp.]|uniref:deoxyribodipyrimidine photo-lyase n=1 Tax=Chitinophaga sp. TaxID=1869181 RepID=UPI002C1A10BC